MTPEERAACVAALEAAERAAQALRAVLAVERPKPPPDLFDAVPLAIAAQAWAISKDSARQRARRGAGFKVRGHWYVPRAALSA
ncbi:hypothetical protein C0214_13755 [Methylobacterium sp. DM1]|nr:hypothetical protein C0214_13755 [Methylobacterium sp. DM1]